MKTIYTFVAILFISFTAKAQSSTANQTVTLNLSNQIDISITADGGKSFTFDTPQKYADGITNTEASTLQVRSNKAWSVSVKADAANFTDGTNNIPVNIFSVGLSGGTLSPLSTSDEVVTSGAKGVNTFKVDYNANPGFDYAGGNYTLSITYTATQQ